jgi:chromosome segregation ATPase
MIARTVSLTIVVKDFRAARSKLDAILAHYQGYAAQLTVNTPENAPRNFQASIRIPAPFLSAATNDLRALGRVENESQSGEEVTQQHADLVARLKTARDTEDRLRAILQQRTGKIEDVLQVEEEIARVRGEIESMEAEQKGLEHRVDFASIDLQLTEEYKAQLNPPSNSASTRMHNAFVAGYRNAANLLFGIVLFFTEYGPTLLIVAAILGVPVFFLWRRYRRMLAKA